MSTGIFSYLENYSKAPGGEKERLDMDELLKMTLTELLQERVRLHGDRLAYRYTDRDYTRTYREFDAETDEIAKGFLAMGLKKGDLIAI